MVYKPFCLMFALAISKTASQNLTVSPLCIEAGAQVTLNCETTDFSVSILFYLNGVNKGGCTTVTCGTSIPGYTPTQSGTSTEMAIDAYNHSRDGGDWTCNYGATPSDPYTVELGNCNSQCEGKTAARLLLYVCCFGPSIIEVIVVIFVYYCCPRTQKVIISLKTKVEMTSATYTIDGRRTQEMDVSLNNDEQIFSCIALGGQTVHCAFVSVMANVTFDFLISNNLLHVIPCCGQSFNLPTLFTHDFQQIQQNEWFFNDRSLQVPSQNYAKVDDDDNDVRIRINQVTSQNLGIYKCRVTFAVLELYTLTLSNMRVEAGTIYLIAIIFCTIFNILMSVIAGSVAGNSRLTDGYCIDKTEIACVCLLTILLTLLVDALIYILFLRTGNEKNRRNLKQKNQKQCPPAEANNQAEKSIVRNNMFPPLTI